MPASTRSSPARSKSPPRSQSPAKKSPARSKSPAKNGKSPAKPKSGGGGGGNVLQHLATLASLLLWYLFNGFFNVANKRLLNGFDHPWLISWVQLATGILVVVPAWALGLRKPPRVDGAVLRKFAPIAALHAGGHALQVAAMGAGSVYFTTVIKATEPLIGTLVALAFTGKIAPWWVNLTFAPIVGGVAYAAAKPGAATDLSDLLSFAALASIVSTVFFAVAKLLAKRIMTKEMKSSRNLDAANTYSVLTCCSAAVLLVPSLAADGAAAWTSFSAAADAGAAAPLVRELLLCGLYYYAYNECGFRVLDALGAVSQAVANSAKRVVVLFFAVYFLGEAASTQKLVGAGVAILGVLMYSLAKMEAEKRAAAKTK
jgi:solute carrier family 35 protein E1